MPKPLFAQKTVTKVAPTIVQSEINVQRPANIVPSKKSLPMFDHRNKINIRDRTQVTEYGSKAQEQVAKFTDEVLDYVKTANAGEVGSKLTAIVSIAKELNISDINGNTSKVPLIGGLIDKFNKSRDKFVAKYNTLSEQIDKVVQELNTTSTNLTNRNLMLDNLYNSNMAEYRELDRLILDGKEQLEAERTAFEQEKQQAIMSGDMNDPLIAQNLTDWQDDITRFEKKISFLEATQMMAVHAMPEIRLIQKSNSTLCEKFDNAKKHTIPAWKKQFALAVALDEQKKAGEFATVIDDATNEFYRKNADLMKQNAIVVAKANERNVIDLESLQYMQTSLITTFDEMRAIENEGAQKRKQLTESVHTMKKELYEKLVVKK